MESKRVLLKLSGEALKGSTGGIISLEKINHFVEEIKSIYELGIDVVIVIGGGNIFRGIDSQKLNLTRYKADNIGMLATVMNAIALGDRLQQAKVNSVVLSAIEMNKVCDFYSANLANQCLVEKKVVICAGGIANPYFSTDTGAVIRALETGSNVVIKGTQVDGVYDRDPKKHSDAKRYDEISYDEVAKQKLGIMDTSAILLAQKEKLPIIVCNIHNKGELKEIVLKRKNASIIK